MDTTGKHGTDDTATIRGGRTAGRLHWRLPPAAREAPPYRLLGGCVLVLLACAGIAAGWHAALPAIARLPLCGGSMPAAMWLRMPGQTWPGAALSFLCMWTPMMAAMMLPVLAPALLRYRRAIGAGTAHPHPARAVVSAACGYLAMWAGLGVFIYPVGAALAILRMHQPALAHADTYIVPGIVAAAGLLQFSAWKARHLAFCSDAPVDLATKPPMRHAWRYGTQLGGHCIQACCGLTAVLLATGLMNPASMIAVTIAIAAERLPRNGTRVARATGAVLVLAALAMAPFGETSLQARLVLAAPPHAVPDSVRAPAYLPRSPGVTRAGR